MLVLFSPSGNFIKSLVVTSLPCLFLPLSGCNPKDMEVVWSGSSER